MSFAGHGDFGDGVIGLTSHEMSRPLLDESSHDSLLLSIIKAQDHFDNSSCPQGNTLS